jgi:hypothetical protein
LREEEEGEEKEKEEEAQQKQEDQEQQQQQQEEDEEQQQEQQQQQRQLEKQEQEQEEQGGCACGGRRRPAADLHRPGSLDREVHERAGRRLRREPAAKGVRHRRLEAAPDGVQEADLVVPEPRDPHDLPWEERTLLYRRAYNSSYNSLFK